MTPQPQLAAGAAVSPSGRPTSPSPSPAPPGHTPVRRPGHFIPLSQVDAAQAAAAAAAAATPGPQAATPIRVGHPIRVGVALPATAAAAAAAAAAAPDEPQADEPAPVPSPSPSPPPDRVARGVASAMNEALAAANASPVRFHRQPPVPPLSRLTPEWLGDAPAQPPASPAPGPTPGPAPTTPSPAPVAGAASGPANPAELDEFGMVPEHLMQASAPTTTLTAASTGLLLHSLENPASPHPARRAPGITEGEAPMRTGPRSSLRCPIATAPGRLGRPIDRRAGCCDAGPPKGIHKAMERLLDAFVVTQFDVYTHVFTPLEGDTRPADPASDRYLVAVLIEYIRSLRWQRIIPPHYVLTLVITLLARGRRFHQLHQFLQYHVVTDEPHVACKLLALEKEYPPAYQMALDMLSRLGQPGFIVSAMLSRDEVIDALRLLRHYATVNPQSNINHIKSREFLSAAFHSGDRAKFYNVFRFFEARNYALRGNPSFVESDGCGEYVRAFREWFGQETISAVNRWEVMQ
ncbi:putative MIC1 protein [Paratrimastix pyriformis]|uniref:MIC1 protein n=1 Tax=Paratrimastix pyriformis TaxID=342808 RepID=A0ABQ8USC5_9EUKA|nr:putative MIC1 protein [Paratrimastix pyriformis]